MGPPTFRARQKGVALFISLVFLLLMTLVGVTAIQTTTLQERMAGNTADRNLAFQASESALRVGERWLPNNLPASHANDILLDPELWDGTGADRVIRNYDERLAEPPAVHVGPPDQIRVGLGLGSGDVTFRCIHPITARGSGGTASAVVILRTRFEPAPTC